MWIRTCVPPCFLRAFQVEIQGDTGRYREIQGACVSVGGADAGAGAGARVNRE